MSSQHFIAIIIFILYVLPALKFVIAALRQI